MIEILTSGLMNSVQDLGRFSYLDQGIGWSGAMDQPALRVANRLVGNAEGAAGLEIAIFPFRLRFHARCLFAVTGADASVRLGNRVLPPWWCAETCEGDMLSIDRPAEGARVIVALAGGIDVPLVLGSRATDLKSGFGGHQGRALMRGDRLALAPAASAVLRHPAGHGADRNYFRSTAGGAPGGAAQELRIMKGAEYDAFSDEALALVSEYEFRVSGQSNRQGMRLEGPELHPAKPLSLHSHGIMPGTIQVPPSGQAVIQLAEANTCGGYPKIAHVIDSDLWKLAQAPPGSSLRFRLVERKTAVAALAEAEQKLRRLDNLLPLAISRTVQTG